MTESNCSSDGYQPICVLDPSLRTVSCDEQTFSLENITVTYPNVCHARMVNKNRRRDLESDKMQLVVLHPGVCGLPDDDDMEPVCTANNETFINLKQSRQANRKYRCTGTCPEFGCTECEDSNVDVTDPDDVQIVYATKSNRSKKQFCGECESGDMACNKGADKMEELEDAFTYLHPCELKCAGELEDTEKTPEYIDVGSVSNDDLGEVVVFGNDGRWYKNKETAAAENVSLVDTAQKGNLMCQYVEDENNTNSSKDTVCDKNCPQVGIPVCGTDNLTYANKCLAECNLVDIKHSGVCELPECISSEYKPVCGSDKNTYFNACAAKYANVSYTSGKCSPTESKSYSLFSSHELLDSPIALTTLSQIENDLENKQKEPTEAERIAEEAKRIAEERIQEEKKREEKKAAERRAREKQARDQRVIERREKLWNYFMVVVCCVMVAILVWQIMKNNYFKFP